MKHARPAGVVWVLTLIVLSAHLAGCATPTAPTHEPHLPAAVVLETTAVLFGAKRLAATVLIEIALPAETDDSHPPPVIFTLDGKATFALVAATARHLAARGEIPHSIVVGVHTESLSSPPRAVVEFIANDLVRYLDSEYRIDSTRLILVGHGPQASTVLAALFDTPTLFHGYLVASPELVTDELFVAEADYAATHDDLPARVFFGVEGLEIDPPPGAAAAAVTAMTNHIRRRGYPQLRNETVIFAGETQASVLPAAISRGLRFINR